jgi:beta-phosphoglucomutase family hydrolase
MSASATPDGGGPGGLGLDPSIRACLFDLDGVLTKTAEIHAVAWKKTFDTFLRNYSQRRGEAFVPFDQKDDYDRYVDGLPRDDGVRTFLKSRGITVPEGDPDDAPGTETIKGIGNAQNWTFHAQLDHGGLKAYDGSIAYVKAVKAAGIKCAVVTSSKNGKAVLEAAGIESLFDARVDGLDAQRQHLRGKPAPDGYLAAAWALHVPPKQAAVFEDALSGVEAGRAGGFGEVVGVDRVGQASALREHGADVVVQDLAELMAAR